MIHIVFTLKDWYVFLTEWTAVLRSTSCGRIGVREYWNTRLLSQKPFTERIETAHAIQRQVFCQVLQILFNLTSLSTVYFKRQAFFLKLITALQALEHEKNVLSGLHKLLADSTIYNVQYFCQVRVIVLPPISFNALLLAATVSRNSLLLDGVSQSFGTDSIKRRQTASEG